ncbi:MAG: transcriptional repressor [Phycisphaeraceae bacterium]
MRVSHACCYNTDRGGRQRRQGFPRSRYAAIIWTAFHGCRPGGTIVRGSVVTGKSVGQRQTAQREAIFRVIRRAKGPLTVDQIHQRAKRASPRMGIATVYRAVKLLTEADEILPVIVADGQTRYEAADLGHHHHFRCRMCNQVFDMAYCPISIPAGTTFPGGFRVEDHELTLYGICPQCDSTDPKNAR